MERCPISEDNCRVVEVVIMVEAGLIVREVVTMVKESRPRIHFRNTWLSSRRFPVSASRRMVYVST
jgi:hypothetical protein